MNLFVPDKSFKMIRYDPYLEHNEPNELFELYKPILNGCREHGVSAHRQKPFLASASPFEPH